MFQDLIPARRQPFRDLVCVAILALSCTHAFVLSSRSTSDTVRRGPISNEQHVLWRKSPTLSQLNVMQVPPTLETATLPEEEDDDNHDGSKSQDANRYILDRSMSTTRKRNGLHTRSFAVVEESVVSAYGGGGNGSVKHLQNKNGHARSHTKRTRVSDVDDEDFPEMRNGYRRSPFQSFAATSHEKNKIKFKKEAVYVAETELPSDYGQFRLRAYRVPGEPIGKEPCVIYARDKPPMGLNGTPSQSVPVRIHDQCITSEVFGSRRCDCKEQLIMALDNVQKYGGCVIYLQQEGRGIGLANKIAAYSLQDKGLDTVDANLHLGFEEDEREYDIIPSILKDMNIGGIKLMTNNPRKVEYLKALDVNVESTIPMVVASNSYNRRYMETKKTRMNHANFGELLSQDDASLLNADSFSVNMMSRRNGLGKIAAVPNGGSTEMAHPMQVSLTVEEVIQDGLSTADVTDDEEQEGVMSGADGYCFGRQSVEDAIAAIARGEMVVVVDDMDRENEGDFIMAADQCKPLDMARIIRYSSGVICVALEEERLEQLKLPAMVTNNEDPKGTAFTVTVDATKEHGITTGISAAERSITIQLLANPESTAVDFHRPGHILPLRARPGGVLTRDGHTEAAIDLSRLAGRQPAGVLCEIVSEENPTEMMRLPEIKRFCQRHGHVLTSIADLKQYRRDTEL
ncbi:hypothetical protein ACA910_005642 [Epithemia clementina (nom. ined.)]